MPLTFSVFKRVWFEIALEKNREKNKNAGRKESRRRVPQLKTQDND